MEHTKQTSSARSFQPDRASRPSSTPPYNTTIPTTSSNKDRTRCPSPPIEIPRKYDNYSGVTYDVDTKMIVETRMCIHALEMRLSRIETKLRGLDNNGIRGITDNLGTLSRRHSW